MVSILWLWSGTHFKICRFHVHIYSREHWRPLFAKRKIWSLTRKPNASSAYYIFVIFTGFFVSTEWYRKWMMNLSLSLKSSGPTWLVLAIPLFRTACSSHIETIPVCSSCAVFNDIRHLSTCQACSRTNSDRHYKHSVLLWNELRRLSCSEA